MAAKIDTLRINIPLHKIRQNHSIKGAEQLKRPCRKAAARPERGSVWGPAGGGGGGKKGLPAQYSQC